METQRPFSVRSWTWLTTAGFILGILLFLAIAEIMEGLKIDYQTPLGFSMGLSIALMQWLLLRKQIEKSFNWVVLSVAAMTAVFLLFDILHPVFKLNIEYLLYPFFIAGILLSAYLQVRYMLSKVSKKAVWWNVYNLAGWLACCILLSVIYIDSLKLWSRNTEVIVNLLAFNLCGPALGYISGKGMKIILENKIEVEENC